MKLDESTMNLLIKGFQAMLKEHGEKMRLYMKSINENDLTNADIYWREASEIEKDLINVLIDILMDERR